MNKVVLAAMLCPLLGSAANAVSPEAEDSLRSPMRKVGAYQACSTEAELVQTAKCFIQGQLTGMTLAEVQEAYTQVVAGVNVKLVCRVLDEDGESEWQFIAYRSLDRRWHLYAANRI